MVMFGHNYRIKYYQETMPDGLEMIHWRDTYGVVVERHYSVLIIMVDPIVGMEMLGLHPVL